MALIDWIVMVAYLAGLFALAVFLGRRQVSAKDYFLAGNKLSNGALAASTIATQCSTNSLLGAPAFVGFTLGGGLLWLQYELAVPLAMAALIVLMVPARQAGVTSIYEILEQRLGVASRRLASATFLVFRGVATGVTVYGVALVLTSVLEISYGWAVVLLMGVTVTYDILGGLRAVVISDLIQLVLLVVTVLVSLFLLADVTGWQAFFDNRTDTLVDDWGLTGNDYGFWPMLIGGLFLYMAYYGCDQSQAQRVLAADNDAGAQRILLLNGLLRFPLVFCYCLLGLGLAAFASAQPEFIARFRLNSAGEVNFNMVFPAYVLNYFAPGFVGLVMVGLIAAAMSSIDTALNSLSAATMEDFVKPLASPSQAAQLPCSRLVTLCWGLFAVLFSFQVEAIAPTILEAINKVGSMVNGPLLALFSMALLLDRISERAAVAGFLAGVGANGLIAIWAPSVSWLWWNVSGLGVALVVAAAIHTISGGLWRLAEHRYPPRKATVVALLFMAGLIALICLGFDRYASSAPALLD